MHTYAVIDKTGRILDIISVKEVVPDTTDTVNIDDTPWLKVGDYIDNPNPINANTIINKRIDVLDNMFQSIEKEQFRSLCQIMAAQLTGQEIDPKDKEFFLDYENQKRILRQVYPIDAQGEDQDWLNSIQQFTLNSLQEISEKK